MLELAGSSGAGRVISKLVTLTDAYFFRIALDETIANTYFLVPFYCFRHLIHCLEISGILGMRTIYEQFEAEIAKKLRTGQPQPKVTGSYKKKRVGLEIWLGLVLVLVVFP